MNAWRIRRYVLDDRGEPRPEPNFLRWVKWCRHGQDSLVVASDLIEGGLTVYQVMTRFLPYDQGEEGQRPILFATNFLAHRGPLIKLAGEGYSTRTEAIIGHHDAIESLKSFQIGAELLLEGQS